MPEYVSNITEPAADSGAETRALSIVRAGDQPATIQLNLRLQLPTGPNWRKHAKLLGYALAALCGLMGNSIWQFERDQEKGAPWLWLAFGIWLFTEAWDNRDHIAAWWQGHDRLAQARWLARIAPLAIALSGLLLLVDSMSAEREAALGIVILALWRFAIALLLWIAVELAAWQVRRRADSDPRFAAWRAPQETVEVITEPPQAENIARERWREFWHKEVSALRVALLIIAAISSMALWQDADDNSISGVSILMWFINAGLWAAVFAPADWKPIVHARQRLEALRQFKWSNHKLVLLALALIMILGASFRFTQLREVPREMYPDQMWVIYDAWQVNRGDFPIFYTNLGREPIHTHLVAALTRLPGFGSDFFTLKFLSAMISLGTLPVLYWAGVELFGERRKTVGMVVGLMAAGFFVSSSAHIHLSRDGLRYILAPLLAAVFIVYAARAARRNKRSDFIKVGLTLGFALYTYQAMRMLPVAFVAVVAVTVLVRQISWTERARYVWHLAVTGFVSFMIFLPQFRFMLLWPNEYWRRAAVSMSGYYYYTVEETLAAIAANVPVLMSNIRDSLLMFNWRGDRWYWGLIPNAPEMEVVAAAFLILGLAAWLVLMLRSRDPILWAMPLVIVIAMLPSALAVGNPGMESPKYSRSAIALPLVYLVAALPFGLIANRLLRTMPKSVALALMALLFSASILYANHRSAQSFFDGYYLFDRQSNLREPFSAVGKYLRGFADSDGALGNAFLLYVPHGWDARIIGAEAGDMHWNNVMSLPEVPDMLARGLRGENDYLLDPDLPIIFVFDGSRDTEAVAKLPEWFPSGYSREVVAYNGLPFNVYRVPPLGREGLAQFLADHGQALG